MKVFDLRDRLVNDYASYTRSFIKIADPRISGLVESSLIHIGTSATMASDGSTDEQKGAVAKVAETLFGVPFEPSQVIGETLKRATPETDFGDLEVVKRLREAIQTIAPLPETYETFRLHPLASWIESIFGVGAEEGTGRLIRQAPRRLQGEKLQDQTSAEQELADLTSTDPPQCADLLRRFLLQGCLAAFMTSTAMGIS